MTPLQLRSKAIQQLVHVIIDGPDGYRTAKELAAFFRGLGHAYGMGQAGSRIGGTERVIQQAQGRGQLEPLLVQLVQSSNSETVRDQLRAAISEILSPYGFTISPSTGTKSFEVRPSMLQVSPPTLDVLSVPIFQTPPLSQQDIVLLQDRWEEAVKTYRAGALRLTLLSLSLLLEHVLLAYAQTLPGARASIKAPAHRGPIREWRLDVLLDVAAEQEWISLSKEDFPYRLRHYRNYLWPAKELQEGPFLTEDLINDAWHKVRRALDDLGGQILDPTARYLHRRTPDLQRGASVSPPSSE